ncbi:hypothetical protein EGW08_018220 [Elysia chlorotica]|uniref:Uncharacterized protein n=1 Tax=Elysia chlorotica TaxID=188477 RepID=A0A3S1BSS5_ELYCH|nr:hypothetical protein EGW08_018220 [Elysia chlorotica]
MCEGEISSGDNCEDQRKSFVENGNCPTSPHQDLTQTESHKESNPGPTEKPQDRPCWLVFVETSLHVVYDTAEARNTLVDVFHDTNSAPARSQTLYGFRVETRYEEEDKCIFECATHNEDLVRRLSASRAKKYLLSKTLGVPMLAQGDKTNPKSNSEHSESTPASSDKDGTNSAPDANRLAIIIGHPHGRSKTITVGQWSQRVKTLNTKAACITHYIYDTATCKGNSGGAVMTFSKTDVERATVAIYNHRHKSATTTPGLNMSSPSYEYTLDVFQHGKK